ncbi:MAG: alkaline phosphatase family protein [Gammaproteobacteria bacterium]
MKLARTLSSLSVLSLLLHATELFAGSTSFTIQTDTPILTMNQSNPTQQLPIIFTITNNNAVNSSGNSGPVTISNLPNGVTPILSPIGGNACQVNSYQSGKNEFTITSLNKGQSCALNMMVDRALNPSAMHFTIAPIVCALQNTRCTKPVYEQDIINIDVINDFQKVVFIVFENENASDTLTFETFKEVSQNGAYFNNFHAVARPSQPNYIAMTSGSTLGVTNNSNVDLDATSIVNLLDNGGRSWKVYAENYPGNCFTGSSSPDNLYKRKHNPFISYTYISGNPTRCANIVNAQDNFTQDVNTNNLPDYSFYLPNIPHSGHDGVEVADTWLRTFMYPIMQTFKNNNESVLFVLTFDESNPDVNDPGYAENKVYTVFYGSMVNTMQVSENDNFYNLLRTLEDIWNLGTLGRNDETATAITPDVWN